ncbi:hypothetical protein BDZ45DRAFT_740961 [Acephala macrosclerotiorum]|nr:hypothetical protein BDZ45DRAFT_740961 [Acephala macrosclerotiorum]
MRRAPLMQPQTSINLHSPSTQSRLRIESVIKSFVGILYDADTDVQDFTLKALNQDSLIEQYVRNLDKANEERARVTKQRDDTEKTIARLREKAKEDRAGYAELRKQQAEEKKLILEQCAVEKTKADQLSTKVQELEAEKAEMEGRCERACRIIIINTTLSEELLKSEASKSQLSSETQLLRSESAILNKRNSVLSKENDHLSARNTKWEEDNKQVMKDKIDSDAVIHHLNTQLDNREVGLMDLGNKIELWRQDVVHHQETIGQQKQAVNTFQKEIRNLTRSKEQLQVKLSRVVAGVIEAVADGDEPPQKRLKMSQTPDDHSCTMRSPQSPKLNPDHWDQGRKHSLQEKRKGWTTGSFLEVPSLSP